MRTPSPCCPRAGRRPWRIRRSPLGRTSDRPLSEGESPSPADSSFSPRAHIGSSLSEGESPSPADSSFSPRSHVGSSLSEGEPPSPADSSFSPRSHVGSSLSEGESPSPADSSFSPRAHVGSSLSEGESPSPADSSFSPRAHVGSSLSEGESPSPADSSFSPRSHVGSSLSEGESPSPADSSFSVEPGGWAGFFAVGLDIGSRTIERVVLGPDGTVASRALVPTTPDLQVECERLLSGLPREGLVVTGYGRALAEVSFGARSVTELKAHARGACHVFPGCRLVLDIGGQDMKGMALDASGRVVRFEMNDRCAAGAGRFLEIMAAALGYSLESFGAAALEGAEGIRLNSMCAVFAESEVVGLVTRGRPRADIARAVHRQIAGRAAALLHRLGPLAGPVVFTGGVARNPCMVAMLAESLSLEVRVPDDPQMMGALGAALLVAERGP